MFKPSKRTLESVGRVAKGLAVMLVSLLVSLSLGIGIISEVFAIVAPTHPHRKGPRSPHIVLHKSF